MKKTKSMKNVEFKKVYKCGKSVANNLLILYTLDNQVEKQNKLGICASKAVGNSVIRHRATRLIRESYRLLENQIIDNVFVVVIARKSIIDKKSMEVQSALMHLLKKADLLKKND